MNSRKYHLRELDLNIKKISLLLEKARKSREQLGAGIPDEYAMHCIMSNIADEASYAMEETDDLRAIGSGSDCNCNKCQAQKGTDNVDQA